MFRQRFKSFKYAFEGIFELAKAQPNFRIHLFAACVALLLSWFFSIDKIEWCFIVFAIFIVLAAEAFNTSLEYLTDLVSPDYHILAKKTKDVAAAGVLLTAIGAAIIGMIIFIPKLINYL